MNTETKVLDQAIGNNWMLYQGDCIPITAGLPTNSIHFTCFSPPFSSLYIYSDMLNDMGNCRDDDEFFKSFEYLIPEIWRVTIPGRLCAVHCKQLVNYINRDGASGLRDFRGEIIRAFEKYGWVFHTEVVIWKDPVIEMQRTKSHGLLYKQIRKDTTYSRVGLPDYLIVFRKWSDEGDVEPVNWKTKENFLLQKWQDYASPVWETKTTEQDLSLMDSEMRYSFLLEKYFDFVESVSKFLPDYAANVWYDIQQTNVLNISLAWEDNDEKHICPLQLDVIGRAIELWSNPGDIIFDPFGGIGSTGVKALELERKTVMVELKRRYWEIAKKNLQNEEALKKQTLAFDFGNNGNS